MAVRTEVKRFLHEPTSTFSYVAWDPATRRAAVIDAVLDYDEASGRIGTDSLDEIARFVRDAGLSVEWVLETHAHADHLAGGGRVQRELGGRTGIGVGIRAVQRHFRGVYNLGDAFPVDGSQFDHLFADDERFEVGGLAAQAIPTPGHTSDSLTYVIGDAAFCGDTLFMPDGGTARCDFPGGDAATLYRSIRRLYELPASTRLFVLHDYRPGGREYRNETTIGDQRRHNIHVHDGVSEAEFVATRQQRDRTLGMPQLIIPSIQVNIRGGMLPGPENNGTAYLKVPLNHGDAFSQTHERGEQ